MHGGILILGDQSCGLTPLEAFTLQGCGYQAFLWQATECTILVAGVENIGEHSIRHQCYDHCQTTCIGRGYYPSLHPPSGLAKQPRKLHQHCTSVQIHFEVMASDHSILSGNAIDYALLRNTLAATTAITTDWAVPWRPHALITLHLNIQTATEDFPPMPATPDIDFRPWTSYQSQAFEIELYGNPPNALTQRWADWISCTEQYLLQEHPWAAQGRGASLQAVIKPLVFTKITTTWKRGRPAFWEQLQVRFQLAVKQPTTMTAGPIRGFHASTTRCGKTLDRPTHVGSTARYQSPLVPIQRPSCS